LLSLHFTSQHTLTASSSSSPSPLATTLTKTYMGFLLLLRYHPQARNCLISSHASRDFWRDENQRVDGWDHRGKPSPREKDSGRKNTFQGRWKKKKNGVTLSASLIVSGSMHATSAQRMKVTNHACKTSSSLEE
jgi:hypothetical protein